MNEVERYLRRATRGLWGRKRKEVREELEAHISERITAHRIAGLSEEDAAERTLRELGEPKEVSAGMAQLYTLPTLLGSGMFLAAVCAVITIDLHLPDNVTFAEEVDEQPALNMAVLIRFTDTFTPYDVATEREGHEVAGLAYNIVSPAQIYAVEEAQ